MGDHALFPPSALQMFNGCNASWQEMQDRPEPENTTYSMHGILLHEYVVKAYYKGKEIVQELKDKSDRYHVLECLDYLENVKAQCGMRNIQLETRVSLEKYGLPQVWGTSDVIITDYKNRAIHVIDWKFGSGVKVYAEKNLQGIAYMAGALAQPEHNDYKTVHFHIVQPPLKHVDSFTLTCDEIEEYAEFTIKTIIVKAMSNNPKYNPSKVTCRWCRAKIDCVARHDFQLELAKDIFETKKALPKISDEQLVKFLDKSDEVSTYINDIKSYMFGKLKAGKPLPGYKLVNGRINKSFINNKKVEEWILDNTPHSSEDLYTFKFKSPAQLEKFDDTLKINESFQELIHKAPGKLQLVKDTDKRPAHLKIHEAMKVFKKISDTEHESELFQKK